MPTAAKLAGAVIFGLIGYVAVMLYLPHLPIDLPPGLLREYAAALGVVIGWRVTGQLAGRGYVEAIGTGVRASVSLAIVALLFFAIQLMIKRSYKMMYDGPMEAVIGVFALMLDYSRAFLAVDILAWLLIGGAIGGVMVEWVGKRWR